MEQIGPKVKTVVFVDPDTKRVLGFGPEGIRPLMPIGTRYEIKVPFDAIELDKWVDRYAQEMRADAVLQMERQFLKEAPARKAIRDALILRSQNLDPLNRELNLTMVKMMDHRYEKMIAAKMKPDNFLVAQAYDEKTSGEDLAMKNPNVSLD
jgi:hypothetical protein